MGDRTVEGAKADSFNLFDEGTNGVLVANKHGEIIYANQALMDLFRASSTEIVGKYVFDFCYFTEQTDRLQGQIHLAKINHNESEFELIRPDGGPFMLP